MERMVGSAIQNMTSARRQWQRGRLVKKKNNENKTAMRQQQQRAENFQRVGESEDDGQGQEHGDWRMASGATRLGC